MLREKIIAYDHIVENTERKAVTSKDGTKEEVGTWRHASAVGSTRVPTTTEMSKSRTKTNLDDSAI